MQKLGFNLYLLFITSWFLHLTSRLPWLGALRLDLLLVVAMGIILFFNQGGTERQEVKADKWLKILVIYSIITIPFVEWPGSVLWHGIPALIKAIVFYYFTAAFVRTEGDLKKLIIVFLICQTLRVVEPLYLHVTTGYWGSAASTGSGEFLNRLSGSPYDVVNPNGLAFIICTILPFLYFLGGHSWWNRLAFVTIAPICIYALMLTGSRSGIIGIVIIFSVILLKSERRVILLIAGLIASVAVFTLLPVEMQDRYLSLVGMSERHEATAQGRFEGVDGDFEVALRRPFFGHGLGTSREANTHYGGKYQPSHNIYTEVSIELGLIGLFIFISFIAAVFQGFLRLQRKLRECDASPYSQRIVNALQAWLIMDIVFSFASYGLLSYEWYLLGGLLIVIQMQAQKMKDEPKASA